MSESAPKSRIFSSAEDYESTEELKTKRRLLLTSISKLTSAMNKVRKEGTTYSEAELTELDDLANQLSEISPPNESLDQFTEGDGRFTADARNNPEIMIKWIAHDLFNIIGRLRNTLTSSAVAAQIIEHTDIEPVDEKTQFATLEHGQVSDKLARFLGVQQALAFYLNVLDAK